MAKKTLKDMRPGESAKIVEINAQGALKRRLMDMGLTRGSLVTFRKVAPLGDPIELTIRGYELSIRKNEAEYVVVE
ncbi:MAG: ferrous iron transport protein A [Peptococcaceae bacterium]|nr:ferrous iron transport protein A [Peptococcaceae bacterium]